MHNMKINQSTIFFNMENFHNAPESHEQSNEKLVNFRSLQVGYNQYLLKES
jgi:hypothetical protein